MLPAVLVVLAADIVREGLQSSIDSRKRSAIEEATTFAQAEIREQADVYIRREFRLYVRRCSIKFVLILIVLLFGFSEGLSPVQATRTLIGLLLSFLLFDLIRIWPILRFGTVKLYRNGWNPKRVVADLVAARVFDRVLQEATTRTKEQGWWNDLALWVSGTSAKNVCWEIADAVARVARETTWKDLTPFVQAAAVRFSGVTVLYGMAVMTLKALV